MNPGIIEADWSVNGVQAFVTTRRPPFLAGDTNSVNSGSKVSDTFLSNYAGFNLATHVGDMAASVNANRAMLLSLLPAGTTLQWLSQVHGTKVLSLDFAADGAPRADGLFTRRREVACAILSADCVPVLIASADGSEVAAVHAGWRGMAAGIVATAVKLFRTPAAELHAWLGPAISQAHFEVGLEVRDALLASLPTSVDGRECFMESTHRSDALMADLFAIAKLQLQGLGVRSVTGGDLCTYADPERFYSYRRDGGRTKDGVSDTGRMASVILRL